MATKHNSTIKSLATKINNNSFQQYSILKLKLSFRVKEKFRLIEVLLYFFSRASPYSRVPQVMRKSRAPFLSEDFIIATEVIFSKKRVCLLNSFRSRVFCKNLFLWASLNKINYNPFVIFGLFIINLFIFNML